MKNIAFGISLILISSTVLAQESDSTQINNTSTSAEVINEESKPEPAFEKISNEKSILDSAEDAETIERRRDDEYRPNQDEVTYYQSTYRSRDKKRSRNDIKTLTGRMNHGGGFGALTFKSTEYRGENMVLVGARGGWIINRTLAFGIEGHGIVPTTKYEDLNPAVGGDARVLGGYGGIFLEPIFFSNEVVHITFPVSAGAGWMGYQEHFENGGTRGEELISEDVYWYAEPGVALELNIAKNFRLGFGISKRFTQDLKLFNTEEDDFNTKNYFLTMKFGSF